MMQQLKEPQYVGEDGSIAVNCKTQIGAWRKIRKQWRDDVSDYDASEIELDNITRGYARLATKEDREEWGDEADWFVYWGDSDKKRMNKNKVWVYIV